MNNPKMNVNRMIKAKLPGEDTGIEIKKSLCAICDSGPSSHCGISAYVKDGRVIKIEGSDRNPNYGSLCSKGSATRQYIYHSDRIRTPLIKRGDRETGRLEPASWNEAMDLIASRLLAIKDESGPESIVFYAGYPKWFRPFLKRLTHNFGSPNYMTESSVCYTAKVMANKLVYGNIGNEDIKNSKCLLVWSTNFFHSHTADAWQVIEAKERGCKIIDVGPLASHMANIADIHLRIRPGTSGALALGMAHIIINEALYDNEFISRWSVGFSEYREYVNEFSPQVTEQITGVPADKIIQAARIYATTKPAAMVNGAIPVVHHTNGLQNQRALAALIGLTGNYDQRGGNYVVNSAGGLETRYQEFMQTRSWDDMPPRVGQDKFPVWCRFSDGQAMHLPFQINSQEPYPIKAMVTFGLNYRMWPGSDYMLESLKKLDFIVDTDLFMTDSTRLADVVLPACSSLERSEFDIQPDGYSTWTRPVIDPIGESRSDVDIIIELSERLGIDDPLFKKGHEACIDWIYEPAGIKISDMLKHEDGCYPESVEMPPYKKYENMGFPTPSGKMEFKSGILEEEGIEPLPKYIEPKYSPVSTPDMAKEYPLILTTGARLPMFIHSRTFRMPWTKRLRKDPMLDINPADAGEKGITQGDTVRLSTQRNHIDVKANITRLVPRGVINMYHSYPGADVNLLIEPDYLDPVSGYPGYKALLCQVTKINQ